MLSGLTYNVHFGQKIDKIIDWLSDFSPAFDLIFLQEFPLDHLDKLATSPLANNYEYHIALSFNRKRKAYGQVTLIKKEKIQVIETGTLYLGTSFLEEKVLDISGGRSALLTKLAYKGTEFTLVNTHLTAYGTNKQRRMQMAKIVEQLDNGTLQESIPVIVLGDLNYSSLTGQRKLIELMQNHAFTNAYRMSTHKLFKLKEHQLDYIFYKNMQIIQAKKIDQQFSDHHPITFILEIPDKRGENK